METAARPPHLCEVAYLRPDSAPFVQGIRGHPTDIAEILRAGAERGELRECSTRIVAMRSSAWSPRSRSPNATGQTSTCRTELSVASNRCSASGSPRTAARLSHTGTLTFQRAQLAVGGVFDAEALAEAKLEALLRSGVLAIQS